MLLPSILLGEQVCKIEDTQIDIHNSSFCTDQKGKAFQLDATSHNCYSLIYEKNHISGKNFHLSLQIYTQDMDFCKDYSFHSSSVQSQEHKSST